jgi:hypothetical protein
VETDPRLQYKFQNSLKNKFSMERPFEVCPLLILNFKYKVLGLENLMVKVAILNAEILLRERSSSITVENLN